MKTFAIFAVAEDEDFCGNICPFIYTQENEHGMTDYRCRLFGTLHNYMGNTHRCYECREMERRADRKNGN
jgi:hypothetical protein